jgi:hypothetical protein
MFVETRELDSARCRGVHGRSGWCGEIHARMFSRFACTWMKAHTERRAYACAIDWHHKRRRGVPILL